MRCLLPRETSVPMLTMRAGQVRVVLRALLRDANEHVSSLFGRDRATHDGVLGEAMKTRQGPPVPYSHCLHGTWGQCPCCHGYGKHPTTEPETGVSPPWLICTTCDGVGVLTGAVEVHGG